MFWLCCHAITAQRSYISSDGEIHFNASTPLEDIDAVNNRVHAILKEDSGEFAVALRIMDFNFRRKLMQEHFNENYMESDTYPMAKFNGKIMGVSGNLEGEFSGSHAVQGVLTIHGISNSIKTTAEIVRNEDKLILTSMLLIALEDYNIEIPRILFKKIAEEVHVAIKLELAKKEGTR